MNNSLKWNAPRPRETAGDFKGEEIAQEIDMEDQRIRSELILKPLTLEEWLEDII